MTTIDDTVRSALIEGHHGLSKALEVAAKIHALLPDDITIGGFHVGTDRVAGQLSTYPHDDAYSTSLLMWLAKKPGWSWKCDPPRRSPSTDRSYVQIAAVTEQDGVTVEIWDHISTDIIRLQLESGVPA